MFVYNLFSVSANFIYCLIKHTFIYHFEQTLKLIYKSNL